MNPENENNSAEFVAAGTVIGMLPFKASRHWILTAQKRGDFPAAVRLNRKVHLWERAKIAEWIRLNFGENHVRPKPEKASEPRPERRPVKDKKNDRT
jgi:predicted DNA-binding transcriptional regulator AlpA